MSGRRACNHPALAGLGEDTWQAGEVGAEGGGGDAARVLQVGMCGECGGERQQCAALVCGHLICEACSVAQARGAYVACILGFPGFAVLTFCLLDPTCTALVCGKLLCEVFYVSGVLLMELAYSICGSHFLASHKRPHSCMSGPAHCLCCWSAALGNERYLECPAMNLP